MKQFFFLIFKEIELKKLTGNGGDAENVGRHDVKRQNDVTGTIRINDIHPRFTFQKKVFKKKVEKIIVLKKKVLKKKYVKKILEKKILEKKNFLKKILEKKKF